MKKFTSQSALATKKMGQAVARSVKNGKIIALVGDLGSGKTTFVQGLLKGLRIKGPYTSPTFILIKHYQKEKLCVRRQKNKNKFTKYKKSRAKRRKQNVYHVDAYRIFAKDLLRLGWKEIIGDKKNIVIVEWADRIKKIIPPSATWIKFKWVDKNERVIILEDRRLRL